MTAVAALAPKPDHVRDEAVYDFDMFLDPALLRDPHERLRAIVAEAPPVFWTPHNGGHWVVTGYDAIFRAARDPDTFSSELVAAADMERMAALLPPGTPRIPRSRPIDLDPPEHGAYRAPLQRAFSPKAMLARRDEIRALADALIDAVIERGHCDFIADVAEPLPVRVFLRMMGLPLDRQARFRTLVHEFLSPTGGDPMAIPLRMRKIADAMQDRIVAREDERADDLLSLLWGTEIDGAAMSIEIMEDYAVLLFVAGLDTVINGMGFGIRHLANDPALQQALRANPRLIVEATEELLRRYSFSTVARRVVAEVELAGATMRPGDRVTLYLPAGNLDPAAFPEPERFDLHRENNVHIAFNIGPHRCLGSHLARIELQILYEQMLARLPPFRLDEARPARFHGGPILAIDSLPIRWD